MKRAGSKLAESTLTFKALKRHQWLVITLIVMLGATILVLSSGSAQRRASKEAGKITRKKSVKNEKDPDTERLFNRPLAARLGMQGGSEVLQPISSTAVGFAESRPTTPRGLPARGPRSAPGSVFVKRKFRVLPRGGWMFTAASGRVGNAELCLQGDSCR